jgi:hypothetical protein
VGTPEEKRTLGIPRIMWEDNLKTEFSNKNSGLGLIIYLLAYED